MKKGILIGMMVGALFALAGISWGEVLILIIMGIITVAMLWLDRASKHHEQDALRFEHGKERYDETLGFDEIKYGRSVFEDLDSIEIVQPLDDLPDTAPPLEPELDETDIPLSRAEQLAMEWLAGYEELE